MSDQENEGPVPVTNRFSFTPDMSVGNTVIDADHMAFFDLVNLIHETPPGEDRHQVYTSAIAVLEEYVEGHFLREEKALRAVQYPRLDEHHRKHEHFRRRVKAIADLYRQGTTTAADDLPELAADWLREHILHDDAQYKNWINDTVVDDRPLVFLSMEAESSLQ